MTTPSRVTRLDAVLRRSEGHRQHFSVILLILKTDKNPSWILSVHHLDAETADHLTAHLIKGKSSKSSVREFLPAFPSIRGNMRQVRLVMLAKFSRATLRMWGGLV